MFFFLLPGDVMLLRVLNRKMIILNSVEAATDLMEKRSWNYSDRPGFPIFKLYAPIRWGVHSLIMIIPPLPTTQTGWVGSQILHSLAMVEHFENTDVFTNSIFLARVSCNIGRYNSVKRVDLHSTLSIIRIKEKQ